ncbi:MAG: NAD(P)-binding protein [Deltaproteobacteria bacterium]|nr:NAD(P)-binding protein [Deltaproteobacteria bacterium]
MNKILIVGAGPSGLVSGFYLSKKGLHITIVEETDQIGGLLKTVRIDGIDIEAVYHHILFNDYELRELIESLSLSKSLEWHTSSIALFTNKRYYNISTPFNYLFLDFLSILQRLRLIKNLAFPRLDINSLRELFGDEVFEQFIKDMLINKFGIYSDIINPKWFVNKLKKEVGLDILYVKDLVI